PPNCTTLVRTPVEAVRRVRDRRAADCCRCLASHSVQTNAAPNGSIPTPSDAEVMQNLDEAGKAAVQKLRDTRAGTAFDREYIRQQIEGHQKLLAIQETFLKAPENLDETNFAKMA